MTFPRFVVLTLKLKKRLQVGQPGGLQPGGFHPVSDETPAAAIPADGVARKHTGYVMLLLKTATAALLLRAHVQSAFQMGESGVENRRNMQRGCAGPLLNP